MRKVVFSTRMIIMLTFVFSLFISVISVSNAVAADCSKFDLINQCDDGIGMGYFTSDGGPWIYTNEPDVFMKCLYDTSGSWNYMGIRQNRYLWYKDYPDCGSAGPWLIHHRNNIYTVTNNFIVAYIVLVNYGGTVVGIDAEVTGSCKRVFPDVLDLK